MENQHTRFRLSSNKAGKGRGKAAYANAYIGFGVAHRRSSTGIYLDDAVAQALGTPSGYTREGYRVSGNMGNIYCLSQKGRSRV